MLESMLDVQRSEVARLLSGVDDSQARARLVPSLTTLLGLVKHATFVEQVWFHCRVAGVPRADLGLPDTVEESFTIQAMARALSNVYQGVQDEESESRGWSFAAL